MWIKYRFCGSWHWREKTDTYPPWHFIEAPDEILSKDIVTFVRSKDEPNDWGYYSYRGHDYITEAKIIKAPPKDWLQLQIRELVKTRNKLSDKIRAYKAIQQ